MEPRIVIVGAGFGGLESAFYLRQRLGRRAELTVVSESDTFVFKPNTIYVPFGKEIERYIFKLAPMLDQPQIRWEHARASGVDPRAKRLATSSGELPYDHLIIATGAGTRPEEVPGLAQYGHSIWTPNAMVELRAALQRTVERARKGKSQRVLFLVPPNNKCDGPLYEMVLMLDTWLRREQIRKAISITFATFEQGYIQAFGPRLDEVVSGEFAARGIEGLKRWRVTSVDAESVHGEGGTSLPYDLLIDFPPYVSAMRYEGLPSDERGFLQTDLGTRLVAGQSDVYAVGDAGDFPVKQAFLALLQADAVAEQIAQRVLGEAPSARFDPVSLCIMEQLDKATFAQAPLELSGDPENPVRIREGQKDLYKVGSGEIWRVGKKLLGSAIPGRFRMGRPFHAGASWAVLESGVKVMASLFAD